jgi:glucuronate isomerase
LKRYFGIDEPLSGQNALYVYKTCNEILSRPDMTVRGIIHKSNVKVICTTDDPVDRLSAHARIATDPSCQVKVLPAFRPDKAIAIQKPEFKEYIKKLGEASGLSIGSFKDLQLALKHRIDFFAKNGCVVSDHALESCVYEEATEGELNAILGKGLAGHSITSCETEAFQTAVLKFLAGEYASRDWVMQLHFGSIRNNSSVMFTKLGSDTGFDAIDDTPNSRKLSRLLNAFESNGALPKMVLYSLNPADNAIIATVAGCFQTDSPSISRIHMGSPWWYNDHRAGITKHFTDLSNIGMLASFIGMLTDSRSYLSYTRHEYFRRILCDFLGRLVENGEYPDDIKMLGTIVKDICYYNAVRFFGFGI